MERKRKFNAEYIGLKRNSNSTACILCGSTVRIRGGEIKYMDNETKGGNMRKVHNGEVIFRENEVNPYMYKVLKGKVALYVNYEEEQENILGILGTDRFFGEISMLTGKPQVYTAVAIEDSLILKVGETQLEQFLIDNRGNTLGIMKSMAQIILTQNVNISLLMEDIREILKQIPEEVKTDSRIEMTIRQYQLKYMANSVSAAELMVNKKA
jgi:CRP-like cAMP-binding protein